MKQRHFLFLDGLRGIAALMVGFFHVSNLCMPPQIYLPHGYMAVDFFFCLSGLVLAQAYDHRLGKNISPFEFFKRRVIRLWPMIAIGAALSAVALFALSELPFAATLLFAVSNFFLLPSGLIWPVAGGTLGEAYPGNNPLWSLFFEGLASLIYGLGVGAGLKSRKAAGLCLGFLAILLTMATLKVSTLGAIGFATLEAFLYGPIRVLFSFACGVFIYRLRLLDKVPAVPQWLIILALISVFAARNIRFDYVIDLFGVLILPLIVMAGAATRETSSPLWTKVWAMLGRISYPFYLVHMPVLLLMNHYLIIEGLPVFAKAAIIMLTAVALSYVLLIFYDEPLRGWLLAGRRKPSQA